MAGKKMSSWGLALFGLPFLAAGLWVFIWSLSAWKVYQDSESWEKTPVKIESVSFERHSGSKGKSTYSVKCAYSFNYNGAPHRGNRVGVEIGSSSGDSYHRIRYDILNRCKTENRTFDALVNPLDPSQSLLFRELTISMYILPIFGLVFALVGGGLMVSGTISTITAFRKKSILAQNPGQPWLADSRWNSTVISDKPIPKILGSFATAVFVFLFMSMFVIAITGQKNVPVFAQVIVYGFCLIPVGLFISGIYQAIRYFKYGNPELVLGQLPFVPGKLNTATLNIRARVIPQEGFNVALKCFKRVWERRGKNNSVREYEEFSLDQTVMQDSSNTENSIQLSFRIPEDVPQTYNDDYPEYVWRVIATAKTPGVDFKAQFEVPVYNLNIARKA